MAHRNLALRGSTYWWRRSITVDDVTIQLAISLRTGNLNLARIRSVHLSSECEELRMAYHDRGTSIPQDTFKQIFGDALRRKLDQIIAYQAGSPGSADAYETHNRQFAQMWRMLADGRTRLREGDDFELENAGWSQAQRSLLAQGLEDRAGSEILKPEMVEAYRDAFGVELTPSTFQQLRRIVLLAYAAANEEATKRLRNGDLDPANWIEEALHEHTVLPTVGQQVNLSNQPPAPAQQSPVDVEPREASLAGSDDLTNAEEPVCTVEKMSLVDAAELCIEAHEDTNAWGSDTVVQVRTAIRLFDFACGQGVFVEDLCQQHVTEFYSLCRAIPNRWGKTKAELEGGLSASLEYAEELKKRGDDHRVGLSPKTIAKHLTWIGVVLDFVDEDGCEAGVRPSSPLKLKTKRQKIGERAASKQQRARDRRANWTRKEIAKLLEAPPLRGCHSIDDRFEGGDVVIHDAWYWLPIMLILYAGRSSELAGLPMRDIYETADIPHFEIEFHELRGLKGISAVRKLPIHPELIRLGFIEFVGAMRELGHELLFPEIHSSRMRFASTFYKSIFMAWRSWAFPGGTPWRHVDRGQVKDKDVHSFRSVATNLMKGKVPDSVRQDILGHEGDSTITKFYDEDASLEEKLKALELMTPLTEHLQRFPLNLRPRDRQKYGAKRGRRKKG